MVMYSRPRRRPRNRKGNGAAKREALDVMKSERERSRRGIEDEDENEDDLGCFVIRPSAAGFSLNLTPMPARGGPIPIAKDHDL